MTALGGLLRVARKPSDVHVMPIRRRPNAQPSILLIVTDDMHADNLAMTLAVHELLVARGTSSASFFGTWSYASNT